ncbi:MAG TPA: hypothetical protein VI072_01020 [Polyangiaceae bacterium]
MAGLAVAVAVCAWPGEASAARPFTLERVSLGAGLRYGSDDLNLGLGARGGYTIRESVYIGGLFDYWFGEEDEYGIPGNRVTASWSGWDLMAIGGYDFGISPVIVVRPFGGFGLFSANVEGCVEALGNETCDDRSETDAAGTFGAELIADLGGWNLGGDFRVLFADDTAVVIGANIGATF